MISPSTWEKLLVAVAPGSIMRLTSYCDEQTQSFHCTEKTFPSCYAFAHMRGFQRDLLRLLFTFKSRGKTSGSLAGEQKVETLWLFIYFVRKLRPTQSRATACLVRFLCCPKLMQIFCCFAFIRRGKQRGRERSEIYEHVIKKILFIHNILRA